jgi:hypothetical protein
MASAKDFRSALDLSIRPNACSPSLATTLSIGLRSKEHLPDHIAPSRATLCSVLFRKFTNKFITNVGIRKRYGLANHACLYGQFLDNLSKGAHRTKNERLSTRDI